MVRKNKWLEGVEPVDPVSAAANVALSSRLDRVWDLLPAAAHKSDEDIEHVHQLRVATRRAMATLDVFEEFGPRKRIEWFRKKLKHVRKAAGEARDLDVLTLRVEKEPDISKPGSTSKLLARKLAAERHEAQPPVLEIQQRLTKRHWPRRVRGLLKRIAWSPPESNSNGRHEPTFAAFAIQRFRAQVEQFFAAAAENMADFSALHKFRIEGKKLRYSLELFAGSLGDEARTELYPVVEELQERLGAVNDHANAVRRLEAWINAGGDEELVSALNAWKGKESEQLKAAHSAFVEWWTASRIAELRGRFDHVLSSQSTAAG